PAADLAESEANLALAEYTVKHIDDSRGNREQAGRWLDEVTGRVIDPETAARPPLSKAYLALYARAVGLWHTMMRATRPAGLPPAEFVRWTRMKRWLAAQASLDRSNKAVAAALHAALAEPLPLLDSDRFLGGSLLANAGLWRRVGGDALASGPRGVVARTVLL